MSLLRFMQDRRGGVAPMFAIAVIPVFGLVGAAVDYSRANSIRAGLQSALDATEQPEQLLYRDVVRADQHRVQPDRFHRPGFSHSSAASHVGSEAFGR